jgi:hypothetical protein
MLVLQLEIYSISRTELISAVLIKSTLQRGKQLPGFLGVFAYILVVWVVSFL